MINRRKILIAFENSCGTFWEIIFYMKVVTASFVLC